MKYPRVDELIEKVTKLQELIYNFKIDRRYSENIMDKLANHRRRLELLEKANQPQTYTLEVTKIGLRPENGLQQVICNGEIGYVRTEWLS